METKLNDLRQVIERAGKLRYSKVRKVERNKVKEGKTRDKNKLQRTKEDFTEVLTQNKGGKKKFQKERSVQLWAMGRGTTNV